MAPSWSSSNSEACSDDENENSARRFIQAVLGDPREYAKLPPEQRFMWTDSQPMTLGIIFAVRAKLLEEILMGVDIQKYKLYAKLRLHAIFAQPYSITLQDPKTFGLLADTFEYDIPEDSLESANALIGRRLYSSETAMLELLSATPLHPTPIANTVSPQPVSHDHSQLPAQVHSLQSGEVAGNEPKEDAMLQSEAEDMSSSALTKTHSCLTCKKVFSYKSTLARHAKGHHGGKAFKCTTCSRTFGRVDLLRRHALLHGNDRKWVCGELSEWIVFRSIPEGDLPTLPEWGCHHRFARREDLERHFGSKKGQVCVSRLLSQAQNHALLKYVLDDLEIDGIGIILRRFAMNDMRVGSTPLTYL